MLVFDSCCHSCGGIPVADEEKPPRRGRLLGFGTPVLSVAQAVGGGGAIGAEYAGALLYPSRLPTQLHFSANARTRA